MPSKQFSWMGLNRTETEFVVADLSRDDSETSPLVKTKKENRASILRDAKTLLESIHDETECSPADAPAPDRSLEGDMADSNEEPSPANANDETSAHDVEQGEASADTSNSTNSNEGNVEDLAKTLPEATTTTEETQDTAAGEIQDEY